MIYKPVYGINEVLLSYSKSKVQFREDIKGVTVLQRLPSRNSTTPFVDKETVKAVSSGSLDESKPIVMLKCGICSFHSKDVKFNKISFLAILILPSPPPPKYI